MGARRVQGIGDASGVNWRDEFWDFDLPAGQTRIYLDCAAQGPFPRVTIRAVEQALELKKFPERIASENYFSLPDQTRSALATLLGARPAEVALTNGASDGINAVARGLQWRAGDEILLPEGEFPANYYPWKHLERQGVTVREVSARRGPFVTAEDLLGAVSERTRLLAASYVHYSNANRLDIAGVGAGCRARGIYLVVDASQAVGAIDCNVERLQCDFLVAAGYKWLLSPYGTGLFFVREALVEKLRVEEIRWLNVQGAENFNQLPRENWQFAPGARRWDVTEVSDFLNLSALKTSVEFLLRVGVANIERHAQSLCNYLIERLPRDRCVLRSPAPPAERGTFVCVAARTPDKTRQLWEELRRQHIFVSLRQDALRIGPNIYNREWEIDRVLEVLAG